MLCYHALSDDWPAGFSVRPRDFEWQVRLLIDRGYRGATFTEVASGRCPPRAFAVTFDDAWVCVLEHAPDILSRLGVPGTMFVPTDFPDRPGHMSWPGLDDWLTTPHRHEMRCMSWDDLRGLAAAGWEIGAHSCSHPKLTTVDDAELQRELEESRAVCTRELGVPCSSFAYPYGDSDPRVIAAAERAGYTAAGALKSKLERGDPLHFPRIGVYRVDDHLRFSLKVSRSLRLLRGSPPWEAVVAGRSLVARRGPARFRRELDPAEPSRAGPPPRAAQW